MTTLIIIAVSTGAGIFAACWLTRRYVSDFIPPRDEPVIVSISAGHRVRHTEKPEADSSPAIKPIPEDVA
jgi:hypothetical protein